LTFAQIRDNIAIGAPIHPDFEKGNRTREAQLETAARLGGALPLIQKLPEGWDTYLERPVQDYFSAGAAADGGALARTLLPRRGNGRNPKDSDAGLDDYASEDMDDGEGYGTSRRGVSGGQMQRIALCVFIPSSVSARPLNPQFQVSDVHALCCIRQQRRTAAIRRTISQPRPYS
jgi:hypothetical protein